MKSAILIPVHNEQHRFDYEYFHKIGKLDFSKIIIVDDASTDDSISMIKSQIPDSKILILKNEFNLGKAESVRKGIIAAYKHSIDKLLIADADGAINAEEIKRVSEKYFSFTNYLIISGARVSLAGREVRRSNFRQWVGRIISTLLVYINGIRIYDPQSPLKIFFLDKIEKEVFEESMKTKWFGECELIKRISTKNKSFLYEFPLQNYADKKDGHLKIVNVFQILLEINKLRKL